MSHEMSDNSVEKKIEAPPALKEFMWTTGKFEATPEEIEEFNRLLGRSVEEVDSERYNLTAQCEELGREWIEATGQRQEELDGLNTILWRKLAVCQAALNTIKNK